MKDHYSENAVRERRNIQYWLSRLRPGDEVLDDAGQWRTVLLLTKKGAIVEVGGLPMMLPANEIREARMKPPEES